MMKKLLRFTALFAVVCCVLVGCDKEEDAGINNGSITVSIDNPKVLAGRNTTIIIKTSRVMEVPLVVNLASDDPSVTTQKSVIINKGKNFAFGTITGVSIGSAKVTIEATGFHYVNRSVDITVEKNTIDTPNLSIASEANATLIGFKIPFTIKSTLAPKEDMTINLTCDKPDLVTIPTSVILKKGKKSVTGEIQGKAAGDAVISIVAENAIIIQGNLSLKVSQPDLFAKIVATGKLAPPDAPFMNLIGESNVYGKVYPGTLYYHDFDILGGTSTGITKSSIDPYGGDAVGTIVNGEVFFKTYPEGTVIDDNLPWQIQKTTRMRFPIIVKDKDIENSVPDGTHYIVMALPREGDPTTTTGWAGAVNIPCWLKIKVEGMNVEVLDGAMVLDKKTPFKVGQK